MALASFKSAKSVVQLSESPVYHYQYSSITDAVSNLATTSVERDERRKALQQLFLEHFEVKPRVDWQTDGVSVFREHSRCLKDLQFVHKANTAEERKQADWDWLSVVIYQLSGFIESLVGAV